jgi:hypothetical protein
LIVGALVAFIGVVASIIGLAMQHRELAASPLYIPSEVPNTTPPSPPSFEFRVSSSSKKYCRYCGSENKTDAIFCEKCGKIIQSRDAPSE